MSYSQEGEDGILSRVFGNRQDGFFVDVGAHHPIRFSNTYKFYENGWRGINIDACPGSMEPFNRIRPLDINLEIPVSNLKEKMPFYVFNETALNTFSLELANEYQKKDSYWIDKTVVMETSTLASILDDHLPANQEIDFLSIDAEGFDFQILISNNWTKYKPKVVLIECDLSIAEFMDSDLYRFMEKEQYEFFAKTVKTVFFKHESLII
ncbi:FkbM family methyltransferase [Pedobacter hiemivivus]|uniref:FkbM family methyltransferase n=1 Tax=Pedobacter hiemivivus TaxID=2530454 RepID=UPI001981B70E|nr:FkbM family methyltransferase [Pedobacter hiemivivus]